MCENREYVTNMVIVRVLQLVQQNPREGQYANILGCRLPFIIHWMEHYLPDVMEATY